MWAIQIPSLLCLLTVVHSAVVNDPCTTNAECEATNPNSFCEQTYSSGDTCHTGKTCTCKRGYNGTTCATGNVPKYLGEACANDAECKAVVGAVCTATKCACSTGLIYLSKYTCGLSTDKRIGEACATGDMCYYEQNGEMARDMPCISGTCVCPNGFQTIRTTCIPIGKIGDACTAGSTKCPHNSRCTGNPTVCTCEANFSLATEWGCVLTTNPLAAGAVCVADENMCDLKLYLECTECNPAVPGTAKCARLAGLLGDTCVIDSDCFSKVMTCNEEKKCVCDAGCVDYGKVFCIPTGGYKSACSDAKDCTVAGNECTDNVCVLTCTDTDREPNADGTACVCKAAKPVDLDGICVTGGSGLKAACIPLITLSGLITILYLMFL